VAAEKTGSTLKTKEEEGKKDGWFHDPLSKLLIPEKQGPYPTEGGGDFIGPGKNYLTKLDRRH